MLARKTCISIMGLFSHVVNITSHPSLNALLPQFFVPHERFEKCLKSPTFERQKVGKD